MKKLFIILISVILTSCNFGSQSKETQDAEKPLITVTIEPLRYFTEAIAGDNFRVVSMVPKGSSPETYDPTPQQLMDLAKSKAYFRIGHIGFEKIWMDKLSDNAPHLQFFDMSKGIELIYEETHHVGVEPHVWNSTTNAHTLATNILSALCALDKEHKTLFIERYDSLVGRLNRTDSLITEKLAKPEASRAFMIYHPALSYFARDYQLLQIPIESEGKEPSPAQLKELIKLCRAEKVRVIFVQPEFDRRNAELIAQQIGANVVEINPLSYHWEEEMLKTANALVLYGNPNP